MYRLEWSTYGVAGDPGHEGFLRDLLNGGRGISKMFHYIINHEDCVRLEPQPGAVVLATECEKMTFTIMEFEPNVILPEHSHPHEQVGYMIEGEAEYMIEGKSYPVRAGQIWRLPGGVRHQVTVGNRPMRVVEVFCPVREDFRARED